MRRFHLIWPTFKVNGLRPRCRVAVTGAHLAEPAMFPSKPHQDRQSGPDIPNRASGSQAHERRPSPSPTCFCQVSGCPRRRPSGRLPSKSRSAVGPRTCRVRMAESTAYLNAGRYLSSLNTTGGGESEVSSRVSASVMCMQMVGLFSPGLMGISKVPVS